MKPERIALLAAIGAPVIAALLLAWLASGYRAERDTARAEVKVFEKTLTEMQAQAKRVDALMAERGEVHAQIRQMREQTRQNTKEARQDPEYTSWADTPLPFRVQSGGLLRQNRAGNGHPADTVGTGRPPASASLAGQN